jgi:hypothetical protein
MRRSVERSLNLLGMDKLSLVYLHDPEHASYEDIMAPGGAVEILVGLKEEGVIEHLGVAGGPIDLMIRYVETGTFEAVITHNRYTLINRTAEPLLNRAAELSVPSSTPPLTAAASSQRPRRLRPLRLPRCSPRTASKRCALCPRSARSTISPWPPPPCNSL